MFWTKKFELGIPSIDEQHKRLIDLIEEGQDLAKELENGVDAYDDIMGLLKELDDYTVYHFEFEEKLMEKAEYADSEDHFKMHNDFVEKIHETLDGDLDFNQADTLIEIIDFLLEWVSNHILVEDVQYVSAVNAIEE